MNVSKKISIMIVTLICAILISLPLHIRIYILIGSNGTNNVNMKDSFFSFGNTTVLDWGRVLPEAAFHSNGESYI